MKGSSTAIGCCRGAATRPASVAQLLWLPRCLGCLFPLLLPRCHQRGWVEAAAPAPAGEAVATPSVGHGHGACELPWTTPTAILEPPAPRLGTWNSHRPRSLLLLLLHHCHPQALLQAPQGPASAAKHRRLLWPPHPRWGCRWREGVGVRTSGGWGAVSSTTWTTPCVARHPCCPHPPPSHLPHHHHHHYHHHRHRRHHHDEHGHPVCHDWRGETIRQTRSCWTGGETAAGTETCPRSDRTSATVRAATHPCRQVPPLTAPLLRPLDPLLPVTPPPAALVPTQQRWPLLVPAVPHLPRMRVGGVIAGLGVPPTKCGAALCACAETETSPAPADADAGAGAGDGAGAGATTRTV